MVSEINKISWTLPLPFFVLVFISLAIWNDANAKSVVPWILLAALATFSAFVGTLRLLSAVRAIHNENDTLRSEQKELIQTKTSLQVKFNGKEDQLELSSTTVARQEVEICQYKAGAESFKTREEDLLEKIARLEEDLHISQDKAAELQANTVEFQAKNVEAHAKNVEVQAKNVELQTRNAELQATNGQLQAENAKVLSDLSKNTCYTASVESSFTRTKQKLSREREKTAEADAVGKALQLKLDEKEKVIARTREYFEHGLTRMTEPGQEGTNRSKVMVESACAEEQKASEHGSDGS